VGSLKLSPVLADAASALRIELRLQIEQLARVLAPHLADLERRFQARLRRRGFGARERKALSEVTPGAAAGILCRGGSLADFFEQVEYNGRRLAKLELPPGAVLEALESHDRLLAGVLDALPGRERENLRWASEQLAFSAVLALNNAFFQVREAETATFHELFQAELDCRDRRELLERCVAVLARYCRADAGALFLAERPGGEWLVFAGGGCVRSAPPKVSAALLARLAAPAHVERDSDSGQPLLDPSWRSAYASCWSIPLNGAAGVRGVLQFGFSRHYEWMPRELKLLAGAGERALLASEKLRLAEELSRSEAQIRRMAAHMIEIEERERRRISRELHDEFGQLLPYLKLRLEMLGHSTTPQLNTGVTEACALVDRMVLELRRIISDLSPAVLEQLGLAAAVRQLANRLRQSHGVDARLRTSGLGALEKNTQLVVYRLAQECCSNIAKHSSAPHVNISLVAADGRVRLSVEDDGAGFQMQEALGRRGAFGLAGMRERVALAGGTLAIESRPGRGTKVIAELPLPGGGRPKSRRKGRAGSVDLAQRS
jgi:signal transduction histidine kinase